MVGACVGIGGRIGLGEEVLEGGQCFCLEFDEVIQLFVILSSYSVGEFCSGLKNEIDGVVGKRVGSCNVVGNAVTSGLCDDFVCDGLGKLFDDE